MKNIMKVLVAGVMWARMRYGRWSWRLWGRWLQDKLYRTSLPFIRTLAYILFGRENIRVLSRRVNWSNLHFKKDCFYVRRETSGEKVEWRTVRRLLWKFIWEMMTWTKGYGEVEVEVIKSSWFLKIIWR